MKIKKSKDLAEMLQVSAPAIVRFRERGMPFTRTSLNRYEYDWDEVLTWLARQGERQLDHVKRILAEQANG